ncbi:NADPH-dependent FMN reductase [Roseibium sp.]|uniref:NADPH-dependent FMN reductase n=1 Tax=Roseibium sp. TaxID=1936156 RepID=UPI003A984E44
MTKLLFIPGSLRSASSSRALINALKGRLEGGAISCVTADPGTLPHYNADIVNDAAVAAFIDQVTTADGVVFVTPEYNYSIPGVLKNAIDWASRPAYASAFKDKPCSVITVSGGALGGVRAQAHLKYVLNGMLAKVFPSQEIVVPHSGQKVSDGIFNDAQVLDFAETTLLAFVADIRG